MKVNTEPSFILLCILNFLHLNSALSENDVLVSFKTNHLS